MPTEAPAGAPSEWVQRWSHLVPEGARVLDLACGGGRHTRWLAGRGCHVTAVDRDAAAVASLAPFAEVLVADLEADAWPLDARAFDAVVVTNYLWRPRWPALLDTVGPGGLLIYETFAAGQEAIGRPTDPRFLLQPGELLRLAADLRVIAFEDGFEPPATHGVNGRYVQRIVAAHDSDPPRRRDLAGVGSPAR